jgi:putative ubiquitin-RnfH superfamily antitoxin RatB of RatAB toxin-antitoxin module
MASADGARIAVRIAWSPGPGHAEEASLELPAGATLRDALVAGGLLAEGGEQPGQRVGIWGRLRPLDAPLADGDRVELYRPLQVDPMEARRARARRDAARSGSRKRGPRPRSSSPR